MKYRIANLKQYPHQPIRDFAEARNWFINQLADDEYVLFTSDHEEMPRMLLDYIDKLEPNWPWYDIRVICLTWGRLDAGMDPHYAPNLLSNRVRFVGKVHESPRPWKPHGTIDIPMIHNGDGHHSWASFAPKWQTTWYWNIFRRTLSHLKLAIRDSRPDTWGIFRKRLNSERKRY